MPGLLAVLDEKENKCGMCLFCFLVIPTGIIFF
jgi:hypothetical protein